MVEMIKGIIEDKSTKEGKKANGESWKILYFKVKGVIYSTFNAGYAEFKEGDEVQINYESDGKYNTIKAITMIKECTDVVIKTEEFVGEKIDTRINSMAISYCKDLIVGGIIKLEEIETYANKFKNYMEKGKWN